MGTDAVARMDPSQRQVWLMLPWAGGAPALSEAGTGVHRNPPPYRPTCCSPQQQRYEPPGLRGAPGSWMTRSLSRGGARRPNKLAYIQYDRMRRMREKVEKEEREAEPEEPEEPPQRCTQIYI